MLRLVTGKEIKDGKERDELLYGLKMQLSRDLLKKEITKDKIYKLMTFLRYYVLFESSEINTIFDNELKQLTERSETMGIEELIETAIEMKKDGLSVDQIRKFTKLSLEEIEKL